MTKLEKISDKELVCRALQQWSNYIQTGDPNLNSNDLQHMKQTPPAMSVDQMRLIVRLEDLIVKVQRNGQITS